MSNLTNQIEEIEKRTAKATNGPWQVAPDIRPDIFVSVRSLNDKGGYFDTGQLTRDTAYGLSDGGDKVHVAELSKYERNHYDADFIAHARADIPFLLSAVKRLVGVLTAIANQKRVNAMRDDERDKADFETGYDILVATAREALAELEGKGE